MAEAPLPFSGYCKIEGQLLLSAADTNVDPDKYPDGIFAQGTIVLTPSINKGMLRFAAAGVGVLPKPITLVLDATAHVTVNDSQDVYIPPTDDPLGSPLNWTWKASFNVAGPDGVEIPIKEYSFSAPLDGVVNLFTVAPVASGGGTLTIQGSPGLSAYQVAVDGGYEGTEEEWVESLQATSDVGVKTVLADANSQSTAEIIKRIKAEAKKLIPTYTPRLTMVGPATTDAPVVTTGTAADGSYNESYVISGVPALPAVWPVDMFANKGFLGTFVWQAKSAVAGTGTVSTFRFMCDGDAISLITYAGGFMVDLFIDGRPFAGNPITPGVTAGLTPLSIWTVVFGSAKPRLIEMRMINGFYGLYTKKPYRIWKPPPANEPTVAVVGDSYVAPTVMNDATAGLVSTGAWLRGIYQRMPAELGITSMVTDGLGGSGYIIPGGNGMAYPHATRLAWLNTLQPDVIVVHGGGANDVYNGQTNAAVIAAATAYFIALRAQHPNAKLVFMEGFAPPIFPFNAQYIAIRTGVQAALIAAGVDVYYIDIATTRPPLTGTGFVGSTTGNGNSDIYVGTDGAHLTIKGNAYIRSIIAPKLAKVLADDGSLVNTLIY